MGVLGITGNVPTQFAYQHSNIGTHDRSIEIEIIDQLTSSQSDNQNDRCVPH